MTDELIAHIHDLPVPPVLDVLGGWVHLRNARVATTSIDEGPLKGRCIMERRGRKNWEVVWRRIIVPGIDNLTLFTFVRNPWDRVCSAFFQCRDRARTPENKIDRKWEFSDWVKQMLGQRGTGINMHFAPQYDTFRFNGKPMPVFVGRFETLAEDWARLAGRIGAPPQLPHWNTVGQSSVDHYDDESKAIVAELYAPEIEALGYEFGK